MSAVSVAEDGSVATITIDRPDRLNALNAAVLSDLYDIVAELDSRAVERRPRAAVLTGAGTKAFVAGADIAEMAGLDVTAARRFSEAGHRLGRRMEEASFPILAAVNGFALGGGCELALCCDYIVAADTARFGQPEVNLGLMPGFGGTIRLAERVGVGWARRLVFTGELIDAARALELGLIDLVVPGAELSKSVGELAGQIAGKAPLAVSAAKRSFLRSFRPSATAADHESLSFGLLFGSADAREGMTAFLEKRPAKFNGQ